MEKTIELKEIIRLHTPLAEAGCVSSQQLVINAQVELDEILEAREKQETFACKILKINHNYNYDRIRKIRNDSPSGEQQ